jgi:Icc-related predicted phosphoesterase
MGKSNVRIAAVADLHYGRTAEDLVRDVLRRASEAADILVLAGDLTDHGSEAEALALKKDLLSYVKIPVVAVLGNHDYESGLAGRVTEILSDAGVSVLDGSSCVVEGVGFAGTKGFGGGFGRWMLGSWGETSIKAFVQEAIEESLKLERALMRLNADKKIVVLHYAPIRDTVVGEPEEIFPFLGSGRLEEPLRMVDLEAVFHGHAHKGTPRGKTENGTPVFNVSLPVLQAADSGGGGYHIQTVRVGSTEDTLSG